MSGASPIQLFETSLQASRIAVPTCIFVFEKENCLRTRHFFYPCWCQKVCHIVWVLGHVY